MTYFEDVDVGDRAEIGRHTFTAEDIADFRRHYDPLSPFAAEGDARPSASAMHVCGVFMRLMIEGSGRDLKSILARGESDSSGGPSPGVREIVWPHPVHAGDTIRFEREMVEKRLLESRPGWGVWSFRSVGRNQDGDVVVSMIGATFVRTRESHPA